MMRCHRSLEEAQGQRRIVSFGGGITLSAGLSQSSSVGNAGHGGGSQGGVCEISSDGTNDNDDDDDDDDDDTHDAFVSPLKKAVHTDRVLQPDSSNSSAEEDATPGSAAVKPCAVCRESDLKGRDCQEPRRANTPHVTSGTGKGDSGSRRSDKRRKSALSSRAAFDRIVNGGGIGSGSTSISTGKQSFLPDSGQGCDAKKGGSSSGEKNAAGDSSDDCCEIMFTRVPRPT